VLRARALPLRRAGPQRVDERNRVFSPPHYGRVAYAAARDTARRRWFSASTACHAFSTTLFSTTLFVISTAITRGMAKAAFHSDISSSATPGSLGTSFCMTLWYLPVWRVTQTEKRACLDAAHACVLRTILRTYLPLLVLRLCDIHHLRCINLNGRRFAT